MCRENCKHTSVITWQRRWRLEPDALIERPTQNKRQIYDLNRDFWKCFVTLIFSATSVSMFSYLRLYSKTHTGAFQAVALLAQVLLKLPKKRSAFFVHRSFKSQSPSTQHGDSACRDVPGWSHQTDLQSRCKSGALNLSTTQTLLWNASSHLSKTSELIKVWFLRSVLICLCSAFSDGEVMFPLQPWNQTPVVR